MSRLTPDVYGRWPVLEALRAGHVERVYVARETRAAPVLREIHEAARLANVPVQAVPRAELDRLLTNRNHQGVAATHRQHPYASLDEIAAIAAAVAEPGLILALGGVQDRGHVSSLNAAVAGAIVLFEVRRQRDAAAGHQTSWSHDAMPSPDS